MIVLTTIKYLYCQSYMDQLLMDSLSSFEESGRPEEGGQAPQHVDQKRDQGQEHDVHPAVSNERESAHDLSSGMAWMQPLSAPSVCLSSDERKRERSLQRETDDELLVR
jgi:hypothetical protein